MTKRSKGQLTPKQRREQRQAKRVARPFTPVDDIRDDIMSIVRNSRLTYDEIQSRGGPCPGTLAKWDYKETKKPQMNTMRGALKACGYDLGIIDGNGHIFKPFPVKP